MGLEMLRFRGVVFGDEVCMVTGTQRTVPTRGQTAFPRGISLNHSSSYLEHCQPSWSLETLSAPHSPLGGWWAQPWYLCDLLKDVVP